MENLSAFLGLWDQYMSIGSAVCLIIGVAILLYHEYKVLQVKDLKEKYDYVNQNEVKYFWYAVISFIAAAAIYANTIMTSKILNDGMRWFYVRIFITACFGIIAYFIFSSLVRIYYPSFLERRLNKLRNTPRISPDGNEMRKLTKSEEDHHLESEMITNGEIHTIDYDVWIDDKQALQKLKSIRHTSMPKSARNVGILHLRLIRKKLNKPLLPTKTGFC